MTEHARIGKNMFDELGYGKYLKYCWNSGTKLCIHRRNQDILTVNISIS